MRINNRKKKGVAAIITTITLGSLIFVISLATAIIAFYANQNVASNRNSLKSYYAAYSGIQDALLKLERNKDYSTDFNLTVYDTDDVTVSISSGSGQATITATSTVSSVTKKLQSVVDIDTTTGLITPTSTTELTL